MTKETKELVEPSIVVFGYLLQEAILNGWRISEQWPTNFYGGQYIVSLERHEKDDKKEVIISESVVVAESEEVTVDGKSEGEVIENSNTTEAPVQAKRGPKPKQGK